MSSLDRFLGCYLELPDLGFALDHSLMGVPGAFWDTIAGPMERAFADMQALEAGAIANPDENRQVGHYWLRAPELAPDPAMAEAVRATVERIEAWVADVHAGRLQGARGPFRQVLVIGIGGSALGPQFVSQALGRGPADPLAVHFFDNTDPDGFDSILDSLAGRLGETLAVVISKSGSTPETRNGMLEAAAAWQRAGLDFGRHAVAITGEGSQLDQVAVAGGWLARFPMWDWVGGRTSVVGPVGLLPAALQGLDIRGLLAGAAAMDRATRVADLCRNPAALLAALWWFATNGRGEKDMVILPYKDRLALFSKYLQQLVMESLGKEKDLQGNIVHQGIAVYGNKGSTDQHAYVQQLREGVPNFFATFIEVLEDRSGASLEVEPATTSGDYLLGFLLGTRTALAEMCRPSLTITVRRVDAATVGQLIALYERAVGLYASLAGINAYHQPGVEAGKKAAAGFLDINRRVLAHLRGASGRDFSVTELADELGLEARPEILFKLLTHLAANPGRGIAITQEGDPARRRFGSRS